MFLINLNAISMFLMNLNDIHSCSACLNVASNRESYITLNDKVPMADSSTYHSFRWCDQLSPINICCSNDLQTVRYRPSYMALFQRGMISSELSHLNSIIFFIGFQTVCCGTQGMFPLI